MLIRKLPVHVVCGFILAAIYSLFFFATFTSWLIKGAWDAQIAAAFVSAPLAALALGIIDPLLEAIGGYESSTRQAVVWLVIFLSGFCQYFALGFLLVKFWLGPTRNSSE